MIMRGLATLNYPPQSDWLGEGNEPWQNHKVHRGFDYSKELRYLINDCLEFDPANRSSFARILRKIETAIGNDLTRGRRDLAQNDQALYEEDDLLVLRDRYEIGFTEAQLPSRP